MHPTLLLLLTGCPQPQESADLAAQIDDLKAQVAALQARMPEGEGALATGEEVATCATTEDLLGEVSARQAAESALGADIAAEAATRGESDAALAAAFTAEAAARGAEDAALSAAITQEVADRDDAISVITADYLTSASLTGYALESFVTGQGYLTPADMVFEEAARVDGDSALDLRLTAIEADYLVSTDVSDVVRVITTDTTWSVTTADELLAAVTDLDSVHIAADATVTIAIAAGAYYFTEPLSFHHPDGGRIRVTGDAASPADFYFAASDGVVVSEGSSLGYVGNLALHGDGATGYDDGLVVRDSSSAVIGPLEIEGFGGYGILVVGGAWLTGDTDVMQTAGWLSIASVGGNGVRVEHHSSAMLTRVEVTAAASHGLVVQEASYLEAAYAVISSNGASGVYVGRGATAMMDHAVSSNNTNGFYVCQGSSLEAGYAEASDNSVSGFYALDGSSADLGYAEANNNTYGFVAATQSYMFANFATATGNDFGFESDAGYLWTQYGTATDSSVYSYAQAYNGTIFADAHLGDTDFLSQHNDTTDFIIGL